MTIKPNKANEPSIESARRAYNYLTGGRGVKVEFTKSGEHVLLTKPQTGESVGLFNPATGRFLDPRMAKVPTRGSTRFKIEENTKDTLQKPAKSF